MITVRIQGLNEAIRRFGADIKPGIQAGCMGIGEQIRGKVAKYPGGAAHPVRWASARQRRYYMMMRRRARLPLRYTRQADPMSQRLGPSWAVEKDGNLGAVVRTRVKYARFVQSESQQQPMHKATGWKTDRQAVDEVVASGLIGQIMRDAIAKALGGR